MGCILNINSLNEAIGVSNETKQPFSDPSIENGKVLQLQVKPNRRIIANDSDKFFVFIFGE